MSTFIITILSLLFLNIGSVVSENILYVAAVPSPSHHIWNRALAFGLSNRGYNVTHIGPDQDKVPKPQNYTHILIDGVYKRLHESMDFNELATSGPLKAMYQFHTWCIFQCELSLKSNGLHTLLNYPKDFKFDLIIIDLTAGHCFYPLIQRFNYPPAVAVSPFLLPPYGSFSFGNNLYPSYIPWYGLPYTTDMTFMERLWNFMYVYIDLGVRYVYEYREEHKRAKDVFGENVPSGEEFERHISLLLANTDPILDYPQPVPPNIIPVGGLHTKKSGKLPPDLQEIMDNAKNGVIVMSLGTNIRSDKLSKDTQKAIFDAFSKLQETVIWKFETNLKEMPKNVIVRKWLPQNDILGHPNVKLFIGHGGALSTQETIFHGVPTVLIPFIVDQYINAKMIVNKKLGVTMDFKNITSKSFLAKVREVLDNPTYGNNIKKLSKMFKDRSETPLERGIFWIEYVMRHGGAQILSTPARDFPFYKMIGFDVTLTLITVSCIFVLICFKVILLIAKMFVKNKKIKVH